MKLNLMNALDEFSRNNDWRTLDELAAAVKMSVDDVRDYVVRSVYPRCYGLGTDATWDERRVRRDGKLQRVYKMK